MSLLSSYCLHVPQRWITVLMASLASFILFTMETSLSITMTKMTVSLNHFTGIQDDTCPSDQSAIGSENETIVSGEKFDWSEQMQGLILSSYYIGYFLTILLGGVIADKFGSRYTLCFSVLFISILNILTPICINWGGATALVVVRVLTGLSAGPIFPANGALLARWIPKNKRSLASSLAFVGADVGAVFGMAVSGAIIRCSGSWETVYYFFGSLGIFCFLLISIFCYSRPSTNPFISASEAEYLNENLKNVNAKVRSIPWLQILRSKPVWAIFVLKCGYGFGFYTMANDMPKYMKSVLKYSADVNGYVTAIGPFCSAVSSNIVCLIADYIIEKNLLSVLTVRKLSGVFTTLVPGIFLVSASYAGCNGTVTVVLYSIAWLFAGFHGCSITSNYFDLAPNYAGTVMGLIFGTSTITGMLAPYVVAVVTPNQTINEWRLMFWIVLIVFLSSDIFFLIFASANTQEWNDLDSLNNDKRAKEENPKGIKSNGIKSETQC